ncbi:hypothetical protein A4X03_0g8345 [Tilletia caries]|uniref:Uncharacterized protein n=1 Tax=Tilletia caries TaxID=13290 RepID=A0A8T8SIP8_9BASI|nr:hypothetical protein A4X03_0g8345 [Tilletia caries]
MLFTFGCAQDVEFNSSHHLRDFDCPTSAAAPAQQQQRQGLSAYKRATRVTHHAWFDELLKRVQVSARPKPAPLGPSSPALDLYLFRSSVLSLGNGAFLLS